MTKKISEKKEQESIEKDADPGTGDDEAQPWKPLGKSGRPQGRPRLDIDDLSELESMIANGSIEWKLRILRRSPRWCAGQIDQILVDAESGFDVDDIRRQHGGEVIELLLIDPHGRIRKRATCRWPEPPLKDGRPLTLSDVVAVGAQQPPQHAPPPPAQNQTDVRALLDLVLKSQEKSAQTQVNILEQRCSYLETQIASLRQHQQYPQPVATPPLQPPQAIDLLGQVTKIIGEVEALKTALGGGSTAGDIDGDSGDMLAPLIRDYLKTEIDSRRPQTAPQSQTTERAAAPPIPERRPNASTAPGDEGPIGDILAAVRDKVSTMPPEKLESILGLILDDSATIEDVDDDDTEADPIAQIKPI